MLQAGRLQVQFLVRPLDFSVDLSSFQPHYGPGFDSASERNEHQDFFFFFFGGGGVKDSQHVSQLYGPPRNLELTGNAEELCLLGYNFV
jgi:hypothetical protein